MVPYYTYIYKGKPLWYHKKGEKIMEEKNYSGQLRLRLPKSLHRLLAQAAECKNVSLNQYIVDILKNSMNDTLLSKREFNRQLVTIGEECGYEDLDTLISKLRPIGEKVNSLKTLCEDDISDIDIFNLNIDEEKKLESMYPVIIDVNDKIHPIEIKYPSIKMVFEPLNDYLENDLEEELKKMERENKNNFVMTIGNIDDINYEKPLRITNQVKKQMKSIVLYFLTDDLSNIEKYVNNIINQLNYKKSNYIIKYIPTYLLYDVRFDRKDK